MLLGVLVGSTGIGVGAVALAFGQHIIGVIALGIGILATIPAFRHLLRGQNE